MGAPLDPTTAAHVSFLESFTQPDAVRPSEIVAGIPAETEAPTSIRKRPSIVVGGDIGALAVVQLVHSPRSTSGSTSPCAVSGSVSPPTSPKVRGAWRCKLFGSTWTGPADVIFSLVGLTFTLAYYTAFLRSNESRTDVASLVSLCDPILVHLPTLDCSAVLSALVYGSLLAAVKYTHKKPDLFLEFVQTHVIVIWVRMLTLYLTPLEAPPGVVPLVDPIAYADGAVLVRDLFFSGHTATTFGLFIGIRRHDRLWKLAFGVAALLTAICVLLQKAHYTIDVVAAPFFVSAVHSFVVATRQSLSAALAKPDKHQAAKRFQSPATKAKKM